MTGGGGNHVDQKLPLMPSFSPPCNRLLTALHPLAPIQEGSGGAEDRVAPRADPREHPGEWGG